MLEDTTPNRNHSRLIAIARNVAAVIVTLAGVAVISFVRWPNAISDLAYVTVVASATSLVASLLGATNGSVWYVAWMIGLLVCDEINNWPEGDPELILGLALHGMCAAPMIPIGFLVSLLKSHSKHRWFENTHAG